MTDARAGHLDLDALADVLAGERPDDAHLRSCGACADRLAELAAAETAVTHALARLPAPGLPEGLAQRFEAALREESDRAAAEAASPLPGRVVPLRRHPAAWTTSVAASLVLVLAGAVGFSVLRGPSPATDSATSAAGGDSAERSAEGGAQPGDADGGGPAGSGPAGTALVDDGPVRSATGTDWAQADQRAAAVPQVLAGAVLAPPVPGATPGPGPVVDPLDRLRDPAVLAACLTALPSAASPGTSTLAVDYALHAGAPALAVVQQDGAAGTLLVTVVGPGCAPGDAEPLLRTRVPAP